MAGRRNRVPVRRWFLAAAFLLLSTVCCTPQEALDPQITEIIEKTRQRRAALNRLDLDFQYRESRPDSGDDRQAVVKGRWARDAERILVDGTFDMPEGTQDSGRFVMADNGKVARMVLREEKEGIVAPCIDDMLDSAPWRADRLGLVYDGYRLEAILEGKATSWGLFGDQTSEFNVALAGQDSVDGRRCLVVEIRNKSENAKRADRLYFCEDFGLALVRAKAYNIKEDGRRELSSTVNVGNFVQTPGGAWFALRWQSDAYSQEGKILTTELTTIDRYSFPPSIDPAIFELEFPAGTKVDDELSGEHYVMGVLPDIGIELGGRDGPQFAGPAAREGSETQVEPVVVAPEETEPTGTPEGNAQGERSKAVLLTICAAAVCAVIIAVAAVTLTRRRKR